MKIIVELQLDSPYKLTAEEIENDLRLGEGQIGWDYDYLIKSVEVNDEWTTNVSIAKSENGAMKTNPKRIGLASITNRIAIM